MTEEKTKITTRKKLLLSLVIATLLGGGGYIYITRFHNPCENKYIAYQKAVEYINNRQRELREKYKNGTYDPRQNLLPWAAITAKREALRYHNYLGECHHSLGIYLLQAHSGDDLGPSVRIDISAKYNADKQIWTIREKDKGE